MKRFFILLLCVMTTARADVSTDLGTLAASLNNLSAALMGQPGPQPQPVGILTPPPMPPAGTDGPTPPPLPIPGAPGVRPKPTTTVQPAQRPAQPAVRPGVAAGLMGELVGKLKGVGVGARPQPVVPGKPGVTPTEVVRPRVMRGVQEEWRPAVTMPMGNVNWNHYLPYNDDSYFNTKQNVMYQGVAAGQAINIIKIALGNASYSKEEGFTKVAGNQLKSALENLKNTFSKSKVPLRTVTEDKRRQLLDALFVAITIAPHDVASDVVIKAVEVIALENEYDPGTIFSYLADMYVGSAVNALRAEIDREIRVKATEELQGVIESKRRGHIAVLVRRIDAVLSRLHNAVNVYEMYAGNQNISRLDKDLFLSKLMCSWHMVESMYHELQEVLTPAEYNRLKSGIKMQNRFMSAYMDGTVQRLNVLLVQHPRPLVNVLQVLDELRERATEGQTKGNLVEFIRHYLPEVPEQVLAAVASGKVDYEQQINQQREALLQSFIRCHYHMFDTQDKLDALVNMLDDAKNRLEDGIARDRLDAVKQRIKDYREQYIRNQKVNKVIQRIETDPELSANPQKIKEVIDDIADMAEKKDIEIKEAQDLLDALAPRYDVIAFANKLAVELGDELTRICYVGEREGILDIINDSIYKNEKYTNPQIQQTKIAISPDGKITETTAVVPVTDLAGTQEIILQSVVAYLTDLVYKNELYGYGFRVDYTGPAFKNVSCLRCTYNGAWLIADELAAGNLWVDALKSLPYNNDGNVDENGKPTRGRWYPENQFTAKFKQFYVGK